MGEPRLLCLPRFWDNVCRQFLWKLNPLRFSCIQFHKFFLLFFPLKNTALWKQTDPRRFRLLPHFFAKEKTFSVPGVKKKQNRITDKESPSLVGTKLAVFSSFFCGARIYWFLQILWNLANKRSEGTDEPDKTEPHSTRVFFSLYSPRVQPKITDCCRSWWSSHQARGELKSF